MGLLDYQPDPLAQGLLGLSAGLLTPVSRGGGFGAGLLGAQQGMDAARQQAMQMEQMRYERARQQQQDEILKQYRDAQIAETMSQAEARKRKAEQEARLADLLSKATAPNMAPTQANADAGGRPTFNAALVPQLLAAGATEAQIKMLAEASNLGRQKATREVTVMTPNGPVKRLVSDFGDQVGSDFAQPVEWKSVDAGGVVKMLDPYTGKPMAGDIAKTMTPEAVASNKLGWANYSLSGQRFALEKANAEQGKWTYDGDRGMAVNTVTGQARPVMANGQPLAPKSGKPTEDENKSAGIAVRMEDALRTIKAVTANDTGAKMPNSAAEALRALPGIGDPLANKITSEARQRVEAAQLDALDAALTLATGAAYTKEQLKGLSRSYFPQIGDAPETVKDKEARLAKVIETARVRAGTAAPNVDRILGPEPQTGIGTQAVAGTVSGGLTPAEQSELADLRKRFGR